MQVAAAPLRSPPGHHLRQQKLVAMTRRSSPSNGPVPSVSPLVPAQTRPPDARLACLQRWL